MFLMIGSKILLQHLLLKKRIKYWFLAFWLNKNITKPSFKLGYPFSFFFLFIKYKTFFKYQNTLFHVMYFWSYLENPETEILFLAVDWNPPFAWQGIVICSCKNCALLSYICQYDSFFHFSPDLKVFLFLSALHGISAYAVFLLGTRLSAMIFIHG